MVLLWATYPFNGKSVMASFSCALLLNNVKGQLAAKWNLSQLSLNLVTKFFVTPYSPVNGSIRMSILSLVFSRRKIYMYFRFKTVLFLNSKLGSLQTGHCLNLGLRLRYQCTPNNSLVLSLLHGHMLHKTSNQVCIF